MASPAVEVTVAVVVATYSRAAPGVKAPNDAGPMLSDSVAGTVPPTGAVTNSCAAGAAPRARPPGPSANVSQRALGGRCSTPGSE